MPHTDPVTAVITAAQDAGWTKIAPNTIESPTGDRATVTDSRWPNAAAVAYPGGTTLLRPAEARVQFHTGHQLALTRTGPTGHYLQPSCTRDGWTGGHYSGDPVSVEHCARREYATHVRDHAATA